MDESEVASLAREWRTVLSSTGFVPMSTPALDRLLAALLAELLAALDRDPFDPATAGARVGTALVDANLTDPQVLADSAPVLARLAEYSERPDRETRTLALLGSLSTGYTATLLSSRARAQESLQAAMAEARHAADVRFRIVFDNAAVAIAVIDTKGRLVDVNPTLAEMLGRAVPELRGQSVLEIAHPEDRTEVRDRIFEDLTRAGAGSVRLDVRYRRSDGSYGWGSWATTLVPATATRAAYLLTVGEDTTQRRRLQAELERQARHDPLTGLANRLEMVDTLTAIIDDAGPADRAGLGFIDLDGFKDINDTHGHGVGDRTLAAVAGRLHEAASEHGAELARIGGDEFAVVLPPPCDENRVAATAASLLAALREPIRIDQHRLSISASIGAVVTELTGADAVSLLESADARLYEAKSAGRNRWVLHRSDIR